MKKNIYCTLLMVLLVAFLSFPLAFADTEGTSSGTATVGNATPTVTSPMLTTQDGGTDKNNTNLTVDTEYWSNCTITDNNQLYNIKNVTWVIWEDTYANIGDADADATHYTIMYDNSTDSYDEIGPDAGDSHVIAANCSDPADHSATSGEYKLAFKLAKTANYTASVGWWINITVYDGSDATGNIQTITFGVNAYYELTVSDASHGWTGLTPTDTDVLLTSPGDFDIDVSVTANNDFKLQAKGNADLDGPGTNVIGLGNVTIHEDTVGSSVSLTTNYANIGGITDETRGASQAKSFKLWIDVPAGTANGDYTYTLSVQVAAK